MDTPYLIFSDSKGKIYHHPSLRMLGARLKQLSLPGNDELIRLPKGSSLFYLPQRIPLGFNPQTGKIEALKFFKGEKTFAVSAFPIPAYLRLYNPAALMDKRNLLPLWAYTSCGFKKGSFWITAKRVDKRIRQSPRFYDNVLIRKKAKKYLKLYPQNRLYQHLFNCALNYNCLAAKNLFLQRWEAPLPTARTCNARCIGCLSFQESDCLASHGRISFKPKESEIVQVMLNHLKIAREAIISFGQGCEGEPLMEADTIARSIYKVRAQTSRGTVNINTNASKPDKIKLLSEAGVDSFRVSLNSPTLKFYNLYFRPRGYSFRDVLKSIEVAKKYKKFVSINLFIFPGFSDSHQQIKQLIKFIKNTRIDMIQWRNLNIDPEYYFKTFPCEGFKPKGVLYLLEIIKEEFPHLKHGYFNLPKEQF